MSSKRQCFRIEDDGTPIYSKDFTLSEDSRFQISQLDFDYTDNTTNKLDKFYPFSNKKETQISNEAIENEDISIKNCHNAMIELSQLLYLTKELKTSQNIQLQVLNGAKVQDKSIILPYQQCIDIKHNIYTNISNTLSTQLLTIRDRVHTRRLIAEHYKSVAKGWKVIIPKNNITNTSNILT